MELIRFSTGVQLSILCAVFFIGSQGQAKETSAHGLQRPILGADLYERFERGTNWASVFQDFINRKGEMLDSSYIVKWGTMPPGLFWHYYSEIKITPCPGLPDSDVPKLFMLSYKPNWELLRDFGEWPFDSDAYPITATEKQHLADLEKAQTLQPRPHPGTAIWNPGDPPLNGQVLEFIDPQGTFRWPFGGDNMSSNDFLIDLNADGVLERVGTSHYTVNVPEGKQFNVSAVTINTVTIPSKTLFTVIHNFHPHENHKENVWTHSILDRDRDGIYELEIGPRGNEEPGAPLKTPVVTFHWDATKGYYVGPEGGQGMHWVNPGPDHWDDAIWPFLNVLGKKNGLNYPLLDKRAVEVAKKRAEIPSPPKWVEPDNLREMTPRNAALALAEANRTDTHRNIYRLITVGIDAPETGSVVMECNDWGGSVWEGFQFGTGATNEVLLRDLEIRGVGYERGWAIRSLSADDAKWLGQTIWWLDHVRTVLLTPGAKFSDSYGFGTTGIGQISFADKRRTFQWPRPQCLKLSTEWPRRYDRAVANSLALGLWETYISLDDLRSLRNQHWTRLETGEELRIAQALLDSGSPLDDWPMQVPLRSALRKIGKSKLKIYESSVRKIEALVAEDTPAGAEFDAKTKRLEETEKACRDGEADWSLYHKYEEGFNRWKKEHPFASRRELRELVADTLKLLTVE